MLILTRKVGEKVIIGGNVTVMVCEIHGDRIRLGFEAPLSVEINREEVIRRKEHDAERLLHQDDE